MLRTRWCKSLLKNNKPLSQQKMSNGFYIIVLLLRTHTQYIYICTSFLPHMLAAAVLAGFARGKSETGETGLPFVNTIVQNTQLHTLDGYPRLIHIFRNLDSAKQPPQTAIRR